jgi:hypothetical protein
MSQLDYVLAKKGSGTQVTILATLVNMPGEQAWIVNLSAQRSPVDWCAELARAAREF